MPNSNNNKQAESLFLLENKSVIDYATTTYRGANPEYLIYHASGEFLSFEEYQKKVLLILNQSFPELDPELKNNFQAKLDKNEALYIKQMLESQNYKTIVIPKVLYDLFYIYFRYKEIVEHHTPYLKNFNEKDSSPENIKKIQDVAEHVNPITDWLAKKNVDMLMDPNKKQQFAKFLENEKLNMQQPVLNVKDATIFQDYQDRENDFLYQKSEFALNNQILTFFYEMQIKMDQMNITDLQKIVTNIFDDLYKNYDPGGKSSFGVDFFLLDQALFSRKEDFKKFIFAALLHEFSLDPAYYTLYRTKEYKYYPDGSFYESLSFGQSILSGIEYDNKTASPITIKLQYPEKHLYYIDIKKSDYHNLKSICSNLFLIPPARRINRTIANGEFWHARTKIPFDQEIGISGLVDEEEFLTKFADKPHPLRMNKDIIQNEEDFKRNALPFLEKNLLELPSVRSYSFFAKNVKLTPQLSIPKIEQEKLNQPPRSKSTIVS